MRVLIREGVPVDWPSICRTFTDAGQAGWNHIVPAPMLADLSAPERWHPANGADVLVGESDGTVAAFTVLRASQDEDAPDINRYFH